MNLDWNSPSGPSPLDQLNSEDPRLALDWPPALLMFPELAVAGPEGTGTGTSTITTG